MIVRATEKDASENPRIRRKLSRWTSSCYQVGESGDISVRAEKVFQQAGMNEDSATQKRSRESRRRRKR